VTGARAAGAVVAQSLPRDVSGVTRDGARGEARRELSKAIYHRYDDPWPVRVFRAVLHWVEHLFDRLSAHAPGGGPGAVALVVLVLALLAIARWRFGPLRREHRASAVVLPGQPVTAAGHRRAAEDAAAGGDWQRAVVERMRATARALEEADVVTPRPGRTAVELAAEASAVSPDAGPALHSATTVFDAVSYGGRTAGPEAYATVVAADDTVAATLVGGRRR
jgi:hypothetical protein